MSATSAPARPSPRVRPTPNTPVMVSQGSVSRRICPGPLQATPPTSTPSNAIQATTISASSVASGSRYASPTVSPDNAALTASPSYQTSPEPTRGRDVEAYPEPLHLGDPILNHKPSFNSITASSTAVSGSMAEVMAISNTSGRGLMRRLSNRATKFARTRRQSSVAPNSRDGSIGPGILRRRSDSTNTAPTPENVLFDSDDDFHDEMNELSSVFGAESMGRDFSSGSTAPSVTGSTSVPDTPSGTSPPFALVKGTYLTKVSKKKKFKRMFFTLETGAGKIVWDKGRSSKCIYIDDIKEIRFGSDIRQYRIDYGVPESDEARFFTIFYAVPDKSRSKTMHLIADDEEVFLSWVNALEDISKHREDHMASLMAFNENAVRDFWSSEMTKRFEDKPHSQEDEEMDFADVERICRNLHIHMSQNSLRTKFAIANTSRSLKLNFAEFRAFVREMKRREDIRAIYRELASDLDRGITFPEFMHFLRDIQCEDVDSNPDLWEARFLRLAHRHKPRDAHPQRSHRDSIGLSEEGLASYLVSRDNDPLVREPAEYTLDRPFNEYFISSSHNTYLVGRQVADVASVEGYIMTLMRGGRSVEIDCWDGPDGQPVVKHGYAMTNSISFREVVNTINKYAFVASHFPVWVSLEVHCNPTQQEVMTEIMKEIFGSRLVTEPLDPSSDKLPSPSELKDRILVKVKGTHPAREQRNGNESTGRRRGNSLNSPFSQPVSLDNSTIPVQYLSSSPHMGPSQPSRRIIGKRVETINEGEVHDTVSSSTSEGETEGEKPSKRKTSKITRSLGDLGVYCSGIKFQGFESSACKKFNHILSFHEATFRKNSKADTKQALQVHNMFYLMRVYPQYKRVASDNFNPLMYWRRGVQMAALNWQTFDLGMQLNQAMFDGGTDRSGYVLKPESMRQIRVLPNGLPAEAVGKLERQNMAFSIDVISAQQLMRPASLPANRTLDAYVEIDVYHANDKRDKHDSMAGIPILTDTPLKSITRVVKENGFNPEFEHKAVFNVTTKFPELVFVKFSVKLATDGDNSHGRNITLATYTAKLCRLKEGYRTLPLLNSNGDQYLFSRLFCRIKVDQEPTSVYLPNPDNRTVDSGSKLKGIVRGNVFSRSNTSTRSTMEKTSLDSGYSEGML
ncbi:hypothetical protein F4780DRAFT_57992 [Xylariomycetidae sp. FL0641]|nr:hypothetical protein F4780DRAFT_57992 [Xylariomycetidae sp. FL0641]